MKQNYLTYYEFLGIETNATTEEILSAYREKIKKYHPDRHNNSEPANDLTRYLNDAKDCLTDSQKRLEYDYLIGVKKPPPSPNNNVKPPHQGTGGGTAAAFGWGLLGLIVGIAITSSGKGK